MTTADWIAKGLDELAAAFPTCTFVWLGRAYQGLRGSIKQTKAMREAGYLVEYDLNIKIARSKFEGDTPPVAKQLIVCNEVSYRVDSVTDCPDGEVIIIHLLKEK